MNVSLNGREYWIDMSLSVFDSYKIFSLLKAQFQYLTTGYVGRGMLSAAVAGSVFTSPPPQGILTGLRAIAKGNKG